MKKWLIASFGVLFLAFIASGQDNSNLNAFEKAYLYRTVKKSPILEQNLGQFIVYQGKENILPNGEVNVDSTERLIVAYPDSLLLYKPGFARAHKGLLVELANKTALWELNRLIQLPNDSINGYYIDSLDLDLFYTLVYKNVPSVARHMSTDVSAEEFSARMGNPSLSIIDKVAMLNRYGNWTAQDKMGVIEAFNISINDWVAIKTETIYRALGGEATMFENVLTAAGSGTSMTNENFVGREADERGRLSRGLTDATGFFPFDPYISINEKIRLNKEEILPSKYTRHSFETKGEGKETVVHIDVWGYNKKKQTTVVIQQGRDYYPLFGMKDSRFLSPDSAFGGDKTYYAVINKIQSDIEIYEDRLYGKKGIDYWIKYYENQRDGVKLAIDKHSSDIGVIRKDPITTKTPKSKRKVNLGDQHSTKPPPLKTDKHKVKRNIKQDDVISLYGDLEAIEKAIRDLKKEKEEIVAKIQELNSRLNDKLVLIGQNWVAYKAKDDLFEYENGARFDLLTQEFTFPASEDAKAFEVKLLSVPDSYIEGNYDDVMVHISVNDAQTNYTGILKSKEQNLFVGSTATFIDDVSLLTNDTIGMRQFFEDLMDKKIKLSVNANANGVGKWLGEGMMKDPLQEMSSGNKLVDFEHLTYNYLSVTNNREMVINVDCFTPPANINIEDLNPPLLKLKARYKLNNNEVLTALRAAEMLKQFEIEVKSQVNKYLPEKDANKAIKKLSKAIKKTSINVGSGKVKLNK